MILENLKGMCVLKRHIPIIQLLSALLFYPLIIHVSPYYSNGMFGLSKSRNARHGLGLMLR